MSEYYPLMEFDSECCDPLDIESLVAVEVPGDVAA